MGHADARIGPNAILRIADALPLHAGPEAARRVFARAALAHYLRAPPSGMVPERDVRRLHAALAAECGTAQAREVARDAGHRTADYLLAHRIPRPAQRLLRALPARLAAAALARAIRRHAWTFAGSGRFSFAPGVPTVFSIRGNPLLGGGDVAVACDYYAATFERLFVALVHPRARVREVACEARGDDACRFELRW